MSYAAYATDWKTLSVPTTFAFYNHRNGKIKKENTIFSGPEVMSIFLKTCIRNCQVSHCKLLNIRRLRQRILTQVLYKSNEHHNTVRSNEIKKSDLSVLCQSEWGLQIILQRQC